MIETKKLSLFLVILISMISCHKQTQNLSETEISNDPMVELLAKMTLEEKIGQMTQYNGFWDSTGPAPKEGDAKEKYDHLKSGRVGSMLNVSGVKEVRKLQEIAVKETRLGIPIIFGLDVIHGHKTLAPIPLAEVASWDLDAIEQSARMGAEEASARGINWTFAPMVDISRDARWGRVMEGAGEDPYLGSLVGKARVRGFQGTDLSKNNTIAATAKHFAGYGFAESGRDYNAADVGTVTLFNTILPPFKACVDENVATVMNAFNTLNGIPATGDEYLQRDILKGEWGFEGFIISDWGSGAEMIAHGFAKDLEHAAILAANAGSDMDMESYAFVKHLATAVDSGHVDIKHIDDSVLRILRIKEALGLFDDPYRYCDKEREKTVPYHEDHATLVRDMAKKSIVLLKNEDRTLPLSTEQKNIVVIGDLAQEKTSPLGSWRIGSDDGTAISVIEGLEAKDVKFKYKSGPALISQPASFINEVIINKDDRTGFDAAVKAAKKADVVVMVLGEHGFQSGEGRSRTDLGFPGMQQELLEAVKEVNDNIVLVVMSGRPLVLTWAEENVPAIVQAWQLGTESGNAIADVLFGEYNPSGKLPMTFPRDVGQVPIYYNKLNTGRPGPSDLVFWSHYIDESNNPLYPFGYGLSYTQYKYSGLKAVASGPKSITVDLTVSNVGEMAGEEVVQLYIQDKVASVSRPIKELKGFEKIMLQPGESKVVSFELTEQELGFFNTKGTFIFEPGEFTVMVGPNSRDLSTTTIEL